MPPSVPLSAIRARLEDMAEPTYREFASRLIPGEEHLLGVRLPALRVLAKELAKQGIWQLPEERPLSMEELMLRGMLIGYAREPGLAARLEALAGFVPRIRNWSVCDSCCATYTFVRSGREAVWSWLSPYLESKQEYMARFGVVLLLLHYKQEEAWAERIAAALPGVTAAGYYAQMAVAWCACELCLLYPHLAEQLLGSLAFSTRRLTLRKLRESLRCPSVGHLRKKLD